MKDLFVKSDHGDVVVYNLHQEFSNLSEHKRKIDNAIKEIKEMLLVDGIQLSDVKKKELAEHCDRLESERRATESEMVIVQRRIQEIIKVL